MLLVIDNYDSFTYNLVQYLGELGAEVVVRRNDAINQCDHCNRILFFVPVSTAPAADAGIDVNQSTP